MFFSTILLLVVCMMPGKGTGMKETIVNKHDYKTDHFEGINSITEVTWNNIRSMDVKQKLKVKAHTSELPIAIYNNFYKAYMETQQHMTRIANIAIFWTPTFNRFNDLATLVVMDGRIKDDGIKSGTRSMIETGQLNVDIMGNIITTVTFDPSFQQFITGSLDFASDTKDINKIKFFMVFPDRRMAATDSTAGFLELSWKTVPDNNGVYEKVQWDVFTFEKKLPAEVESMAGLSAFKRIQSYLNKKYNDRKDQLQMLNDHVHSLQWGSDHGLNTAKTRNNELINASLSHLRDSARRIDAIQILEMNNSISNANSQLIEAMASGDVEDISSAKSTLVKILRKYNLEIPEDLLAEDGHISIGEPQ